MATVEGSLGTIARAVVDAFNRRDSQAFVAMADTNVEFYPTPLVREHDVHRGHEGLKRWLEEIEAAGTRHRLRVCEVRTLDTRRFLIVGEVVVDGEMISPITVLARLTAAKKIVEMRAFLSDERILAQVGVTGDSGP